MSHIIVLKDGIVSSLDINDIKEYRFSDEEIVNIKNTLDNITNKELIIQQINALTEVVKANSGWFGDETVIREANKKIQELIKLL